MGVMDERSSRVFIGVSLLVLLWIGTYWVYDPDRRQRTPPISFAEPDPQAEPERGGSAPPVSPFAPPSGPIPGSPGDALGLLGRGLGIDPAPGVERAPTGVEPPPRVTPPAPRVVAPAFRDHTIQPGDTFETIARRYLGSASLSSAIARANPLKDPRRLRVGEVLRVPLDPDNIQGRVVLEDGSTPAEPVRPETPSVVEYRVQAGDTLSKIAQAYYGSTRHADFIFRSNRDTMASPDSLRVGQTLRLPPLPAGAAEG